MYLSLEKNSTGLWSSSRIVFNKPKVKTPLTTKYIG
jgi:hypothetical protein